MQIAQITDLRPDGRPPYNSPNGTLYGFVISFDDNRSGLCNSKSQTPPYRIGDTVGYEVTGNFQGKDKLKVTKNPDKPFGSAPAPQVQPPYQSAAAREQETPGFNAGYPKPTAPRQAVPALPPGTDFDVQMRAQANLYVECVNWATNVATKLDAMGLGALTPDHFQACVSSLYIQANRDGLRVPSPTANRPTVARSASPAHPDSHPDLEAAIPDPPF